MKKYSKYLLTPLAFAISLAACGQAFAASSLTIPLKGTGIVNEVSKMTATPSLLELVQTEVGSSSVKTLTLTHVGAAGENSIVLNGVSVGGYSSTEFSVTSPGYTVLEPGQSVDVEVSFFPQTSGVKTASLLIDHDGASEEHLVFLKGVAKEKAVSILSATPEGIAMGSVKMGFPITKIITVNSTGESTAPLINIGDLTVTGENADSFTAQVNGLQTLNPGGASTIAITMKSNTYGEKNATLTIAHDGANPKLKVALSGKVKQEIVEQTPVFTGSVLGGLNISHPTSLQFGPDGKLYVSQMNGIIQVLTVVRNAANGYVVTDTVTLNQINEMTNYDDDGAVNSGVHGRLVTGLLVTGSAAAPTLYVSSSDPRQGGGPSGHDSNLDTNSGVVSRLTKQGGGWVKQDLVRGLPRSEENHAANGMVMDGNKLLISVGGNTNAGAPSNNFAEVPEYALGAAIVEINLNALGALPYDLPTLDDEDRAGVADANDPFGGNNGKNQAILKANSPVSIYSPGYRNAYDLVLTQAGRLYTFDNGGNSGWGGAPINCSNTIVNQGQYFHDGLHYVSHRGYFGGHANPTRGSKANTFNASNPQSPIQVNANPVECTFQSPGGTDSSLITIPSSTNGMDEYTASNFGGAMQGDLLAVSFNKALYRVELNAAGNNVMSKSKLVAVAGNVPLDVTTQADNQIFPGTIWVADQSGSKISVYEPNDY